MMGNNCNRRSLPTTKWKKANISKIKVAGKILRGITAEKAAKTVWTLWTTQGAVTTTITRVVRALHVEILQNSCSSISKSWMRRGEIENFTSRPISRAAVWTTRAKNQRDQSISLKKTNNSLKNYRNLVGRCSFNTRQKPSVLLKSRSDLAKTAVRSHFPFKTICETWRKPAASPPRIVRNNDKMKKTIPIWKTPGISPRCLLRTKSRRKS